MHRRLENVSWRRLRVSLLVAMLAVPAVGLRLAAVKLNPTPHGDVLVDAVTAESLAQTGRFTVPWLLLRTAVASDMDGIVSPVEYRQPLWPLLAAPLARLTGDGYLAVRLLSLISGMVLLGIVFLLSRRLSSTAAAAVATLCVAYSYLHVDFSGNGSLYHLLAACLLLFPLLIERADRPPGAMLMGLLLGGSLLLHGSARILPVAFLLVQGLRWKRGELERPLLALGLPLAVAGVLVSPWLVRNHVVFGDALHDGNLMYFNYKLGVPWSITLEDDQPIVHFQHQRLSSAEASKRIARWSLGNAAYAVRKTAVLAPVFSLSAVFGAWLLWRRFLEQRRPSDLATILVVALFGLLTVAWPVVKFRTLVAIVPLIFGLGVHGAMQVPARRWRRAILSAGVAGVLLLSSLTFLRSPSHTYYYDGVLTRDAFGRAGEADYVREQAELEKIGEVLASLPAAPVMAGQIQVYWYARRPLLQAPPPSEAEVLKRLADRYRVGYVVADRRQVEGYRRVLGGRVHHLGPRFGLLDLRSEGK